jgi:hypothetical protein
MYDIDNIIVKRAPRVAPARKAPRVAPAKRAPRVAPARKSVKIAPPNKALSTVKDTIRNGDFDAVVDFIIVSNPDYLPSSKDFTQIFPNGNISWKQADQLYDLFKLKGFKPDLYCLEVLLKHNSSREGFPSILMKHIGDLMADGVPLESIIDTSLNVNKMQIFLDILVLLGKIPLGSYHKLMQKSLPEGTLLSLLDNLKDKPNLETLKIACSKGFKILVNKLCEQQGIIPDQECLEEACSRYTNTDIICKLYNYKLFANKRCFFNMINSYIPENKLNDTVQLLIFCGLNLDADCITFAKANGYTLSNDIIHRFS